MMLRGARPAVQLVPRAALPRTMSTRVALSSAVQLGRAQRSPLRPTIANSSLSLLPRWGKAGYANSPYDKIDVAAEKEIAKKKLKSRPEEVSTESSTRQVFESSSRPASAVAEDNVQDGLEHDIGIVKDTFNMQDVPKEPYMLGLAGTLPYLGTSLTTVYLSWDLNTEWPASSALLNQIHLNHDSARYLLNLLEPIQLGYGAIIISFLGAVHWGMEYAATRPSVKRTQFRYGIGVLASVVAWPTLFMPVQAALISQFAAFTFLYLADSRATTRGWAPAWYGRYRFILTAVVGVAIFISLVGREKIGADAPRIGAALAHTIDTTGPDHSQDWAALEAEEKKKNRKEKAEAEKKKKQEQQKEEAQKKAGSKQNEKAEGGNEAKKSDAGKQKEPKEDEGDMNKDKKEEAQGKEARGKNGDAKEKKE